MQLETPRVSLGPVLEKLATSERITITVERLPSGNIRVKSNSWDHERVLLRNQVPEVRSVSDRLHVARKAKPLDECEPPIVPYDPYGPGSEDNIITEETDASSAENRRVG